VDGRVPDAWRRRDSVIGQSLADIQMASMGNGVVGGSSHLAEDAFVMPEQYTSEVWGSSD
jgi:hypothetical protein